MATPAKEFDFDPALLVLFKDNPAAAKLAATWPHVPEADRAYPTEAWARVSGLQPCDVKVVGDMLLSTGLCHPDGTVPPRVLDAVKAVAHAWLSDLWRGE